MNFSEMKMTNQNILIIINYEIGLCHSITSKIMINVTQKSQIHLLKLSICGNDSNIQFNPHSQVPNKGPLFPIGVTFSRLFATKIHNK